MNNQFWTKRLMLMILLAQLVLTGVTIAAADIPENPDTSSWHAWELPNDALALGSPIDASFLLEPRRANTATPVRWGRISSSRTAPAPDSGGSISP
ncbi:MAG: hypothetical protein K0Q90_520 [Paenibacillaceae bacterium]|jgi:hypothetical protein|nr:hypothetical protein [Paenibacillaceae bacterium]